MILSLSFQAKLFITTILWGVGLAFFYDLIRVLRIAIKHKKVFSEIEDFLYWIIISLTVFFVMLSTSFGEVRAFCVCGVFIGMILYFTAMSKLFLSVSEAVIRVVKKIIGIFIEIIMTPFMLIYKIFRIPVKKTYNLFTKVLQKLLQLCKIYAKIYLRRLRVNNTVLQKKKKNGADYAEKEQS